MNNQAGKGSRPRHVKGAVFRENFDSIFRKHQTQKPMEPEMNEKLVKHWLRFLRKGA